MSRSHDNRTDGSTESAGRAAPLAADRIQLSVVLPAYNEAQRLPPYLESIRSYCMQRFGQDYEVIVVDDGSSDPLVERLLAWGRDWPQLQTRRLPEHRGKGAAVRAGMLAAAGRRLLFADADGATPIEEASRLQAELERGADVAIGSRLVTGSEARQRRTWSRRLLGRAFADVTRALFGLPVRDTQCGFKMFRREVGKVLFGLQREEGFLFDLELLILADRQGYRVVEVPVNWSEKSGGSFHWPRELWRITRGLHRLHGQRRLMPSGTRPAEVAPPQGSTPSLAACHEARAELHPAHRPLVPRSTSEVAEEPNAPARGAPLVD